MRTFEYRLYPNNKQHHLLMQCLIESRGIYNAMLETVKAQYEATQTFPSKYDLEAAFKGYGEHVPATTVQMLADRLSKSLKRFLAARKHAIAGVGFPRFKPPNRWHSLQLRQYGKDCSLHEDNKHFIVPSKIGKALKIKLHRPLEGKPRTAHLVLRADGHWYALIVCETVPQTEQLACEHPSKGYQHIVVEDLQITKMVKNHISPRASWTRVGAPFSTSSLPKLKTLDIR